MKQSIKRRFHWKGIALLFMAQMLFAFGVNAQKVTGKVVDDMNLPLPGVTVMVKGDNTKGTITDMDGNYSISVNDANTDVLVYSFIGMETVEEAIKGRTAIDKKMVAETTALDEVVAIGYGVAKKRDLTGSVASVKGEALQAIPVASAAEAITGKLAGVQITTTEGSPDAEIKIRVRGGGSISQDNSPLYIVDGFPVESISDIPPSDIQSIDVLKDASSTAIYGSRGANGVIIVTTKSAKAGKFSVSYNGYYGLKKIASTLDVLDPYQFATLQYERAVLQGTVEKEYEPYFGAYGDLDIYKSVVGTDWQNEIFGKIGETQNHNVSIAGGTDQAAYNLSFSHIDNEAIMENSNFVRDNLNFKIKAKPNKLVKLDFSMRYSDTEVNGSGANDVTGTEKSTSDSRLKNAVVYTPITLKSGLTASDDTEENLGSLYPPDIAIADNDRYKRDKKFNVTGGISISATKQLTFRSDVGFDYAVREDNRFYGLSTYYVRGGDAQFQNQPASQFVNRFTNKFRNSNTVNYDFSNILSDDHSLSAMVGHEVVIENSRTLTDIVEGYPVTYDSEKAWTFPTQGTSISTENYYTADDRLLSFFGRTNYSFKGRYLFQASLRYDGTSVFATGKQWGAFPSASAAWRLSDEPFMSGVSGWLSNLKFRANYGLAGNNRIEPLSYMRTYSSKATGYLPSSLSSSIWTPGQRMDNDKMMWETTATTGLGLDYGFINNRISGAIDVYYNETSDLLIDYLTSGSGYQSQYRNLGTTSNKGIELSLNTAIVSTKDLQVNFGINISKNIGEVVDLGDVDTYKFSSGWTSWSTASNDYLLREGDPVGLMWGFETDGWYSADEFTHDGNQWIAKDGVVSNTSITGPSWGPGALKLKDKKTVDTDGDGVADAGDGIINDDDRSVIGNSNAEFSGGFNFDAAYKGFDIAANFTFVYGNDIYNANRIEMTSGYYPYRNVLGDMAPGEYYSRVDASTGEEITDVAVLNEMNKDASIWAMPMGSYAFHSWAVEDGSFLRLSSLTIGYSLPKSVTEKLHMSRFRVYVSGSNLWLLTNYSGYDPEVDSRRKTPLTPGVDFSAYPKSRSVNFGVNVTF